MIMWLTGGRSTATGPASLYQGCRAGCRCLPDPIPLFQKPIPTVREPAVVFATESAVPRYEWSFFGMSDLTPWGYKPGP